MSQNDDAVLTAAVGYVYIAEAGTSRPTPEQIADLDAEAFGSSSSKITVSAVPTGGTFKVTVGDGSAPKPAVDPVAEAGSLEGSVPAAKPTAKTAKAGSDVEVAAATPAPSGSTADLPFDTGASEVQTALESIESVGEGNVKVTGDGFTGDGFVISFVGKLQGVTVPVSVDGKLEPASVTATAAVNTAPNGWTSVGHTSRGELPEFGYDGGDTEVRGSWQNESLREVTTKTVDDFLKLTLLQFDTESFELYYGKDGSSAKGVFGVAGGTPVPLEKALLIIIVDGDTKIAFYSPKASIRRDDSIQLKVDDFGALPIRATFLKYGSRNKFEWINEDLFD